MLLKLFSYLALVSSLYFGYNNFILTPDSEQAVDYFEKFSYTMTGNYSAFVLGGTGAIGKGIVKALAKSRQFEKVTLIGRRKQELPSSEADLNYEKFHQEVIDFDKIPEYSHLFKGYDFGFYAIGVSQTKVSEAEFRKVELENALQLAKVIREADCKSLHWVTGEGTNKNSWFLFGKVKGQVEEEITNMGFPRVSFYRPGGVLTSDNSGMAGSTSSIPTKIFKALNFMKWMTLESDLLGKFIVSNALHDTDKKVEIFQNKDINSLGKQLPM